MNIIKTFNGNDLIVGVEGRIDTITSQELNSQLNEEIDKISSLTLDFEKLEYMSSAGLRVLIVTQKKLKQIQDNYLNHVTKTIITACKNQDIGKIILGYNNKFQYRAGMGKKQNQIFSHYAFKKFKEKLENKCKIHELILIIQEESYTSKSSFLDNDILPGYQANSEKETEYDFKGKRIKRGLYKTCAGILLNADVNAAANIIRKSKQKFNLERLYKWVQYAPNKIKPLKTKLQRNTIK